MPPETRGRRARLHRGPQEAEQRQASCRPRQAHQWARGLGVRPWRGLEHPGALFRPHPGRTSEGPARRALPRRPGCPRLEACRWADAHVSRREGLPEPQPIEVRSQSQEALILVLRPGARRASPEGEARLVSAVHSRSFDMETARMPLIDFWCELASPYTYLSACRIDALAARAHVDVRWRPFTLHPIFRAVGWQTSPFEIYADKGRYMWRDMEREAERLSIPFHKPTAFPRNGVPAAKIAMLGT